jgi:hypothetical protein
LKKNNKNVAMTDNLNPTPCNEGVLANMAALAQQVSAPVPPYPLFFSNSGCGESLTGSSFPSYYLPINCPPGDVIPDDSADNCLRVMSGVSRTSTQIQASNINLLPSTADTGTTTQSNIFPASTDKLFSWYVPPNFSMIFFEEDPTGKTVVEMLSQGKGWEVSNNYLQVDSCHSALTLANGDSFFTAKPTITPTQDDCQDLATATQAWKDARHTAPYFILIEEENFNRTIVDMCTADRDVLVGSSSLNRVWFPQSSGCDQYMETLCAATNVAGSEFAEVCSCFTQQAELDRKFGADQRVPTCCFGGDPSGDVNKSCAFNTQAYKTKDMLSNCCSFAQCQKVSGSIQNPNDEVGVTCQGTFVEFPKVPAVTPTPQPGDTIEVDEAMPGWVWVVFGAGVLFLLLFLVGLAFI